MRKLALLALATLAACAVHRPAVTLPSADLKEPHRGFVDADDGPHPSPSPDYFEWWYYDATLDDGSSATVALYAAEMFGTNGPPAVLVNVLDPSGRAHTSYQKFTRDVLSFGGPGEVRIAESSAQKLEGGAVRVRAFGKDGDGEVVSVDLTFTPQMPGFKPGDGAVRFDGKVALGWAVPIPRAAVEGTVRVGAEERHATGLGYHDHNWGELNLKDTMAYWYWGRIASKDVTLVYASVHFRDELGVEPLDIVVAGDTRRMTEALAAPEFTAGDAKYLATANRDIPEGLRVVAKDHELALQLDPKKVLEADDLSLQIPWWERPFARLRTHPAYVRQLCDYVLASRGADGLPRKSEGRAIAEFMYVWRR